MDRTLGLFCPEEFNWSLMCILFKINFFSSKFHFKNNFSFYLQKLVITDYYDKS